METLSYTAYSILLLGSVYVLVSSDVMEAEKAVFFEGKQVIPRSEASGQATLKMYSGQTASLEFCLLNDTEIEVLNVWYSNDGDSDLITVTVDNITLGEVLTQPLSNIGEGWNTFKPSGRIGSIIYLSKGRHQLSLSVRKSDAYGVEIDKIELFLQKSQNQLILDCKVLCFDDISYDRGITGTDIGPYTPKGKLVQKSKKTMCTEEDNIEIPIFHDSARKYIISANLPQYASVENNRKPDWVHCKIFFSLWSFSDIDLSKTQKITQASAGATMSVTALDTDMQSNLITYVLIIEFALNGPSIGMTDSVIGSVIKVSFRGMKNPIHVSMQYFDKWSHWSELTDKIIYSNAVWDTWNVPDFVWREGRGNSIRLTITAFKKEPIELGDIAMSRRDEVKDHALVAYDDGMTIIEVVDMDVWWRVNETMTLKTLNNGRVFQGLEYFRIYRKIPWSEKSFSQVFVMYQDGNMRLLPYTPVGLDWIPFGSSILIGQSDHMAVRPAAPLRHVDIDPKELTIQLTYLDGGYLSLKLDVTVNETMVIVSDAVYARPLASYPFLTFRSMWVVNGNADVDHVSVDGNEPYHILSGWSTLNGNSFAFFRRCISKHNTLSPDLRVKIMG